MGAPARACSGCVLSYRIFRGATEQPPAEIDPGFPTEAEEGAGPRWSVTPAARATGPRLTDRRTRCSFRPNRPSERREIECFFDKGLHYLGDWHTHPQARPRPSGTDIESMSEMVRQSRYELEGFLMVIVGTSELPEGLWVSLHRAGGALERLSFEQPAPGEPLLHLDRG
ncbi:MAG: Mov34/MPN/PAD-1 family protein [Methyloceanibacter sp.]